MGKDNVRKTKKKKKKKTVWLQKIGPNFTADIKIKKNQIRRPMIQQESLFIKYILLVLFRKYV